MPRLELTHEEAEIIYRKRENERFYRAGKIEAYNEIFGYITTAERTRNEITAFIIEQKAKLK